MALYEKEFVYETTRQLGNDNTALVQRGYKRQARFCIFVRCYPPMATTCRPFLHAAYYAVENSTNASPCAIVDYKRIVTKLVPALCIFARIVANQVVDK